MILVDDSYLVSQTPKVPKKNMSTAMPHLQTNYKRVIFETHVRFTKCPLGEKDHGELCAATTDPEEYPASYE